MIRKTENNEYVEKARYQSYILNPSMRNVRNADYITGNRASMENFIFKISDPKMGQIVNAEAELIDLQKQFSILSQAQINAGKLPMLEMPPELQERKDMWSAKLTVHKEELAHVQSELAKLNDTKEVAESKLLPRSSWSSGTMRDGVLTEIGGFAVLPNESGLLCIADERCPFNTFPVHRFHSAIVAPIFKEESYRKGLATRKAITTGTPRQPIKKASTPVWDKEKDVISYPGYSENVLKKLKINT